MSADATLETVRAAKPAAEKLFAQLVGDVAIGITRVDGGYGLKVNLTSPPAANVVLPESVNGVPVRIEVTGPIRKRSSGPSQ